MSTRSRIGILRKDGSIDSIYCHFDGYPDWVGQKLYKNYNSIDKINDLINLGDISHLEDNLEPNPNMIHEFGYDTEQPNVVVAYHRDRNEDWEYVKPKHFIDINEFEKYCLQSDQEYAYLYDENNDNYLWSEIPWNTDNKMDFKDLKEKLIELDIINLKDEEFDKIVWKVIEYEKENDLYEFQNNYASDIDAFNSLKKYFNDYGFDYYVNSLKDNIMYLDDDKNDSVLGNLYLKANNLLKDINQFNKDSDMEL